MALPLEKKRYTYQDYLTWPDDERYELIDGEPYRMSPAPTVAHQRISIALSGLFHNYLKGGKCEVLAAPIDVRFPDKGRSDEDIVTVVQPDIIIVCDRSKIEQRGVIGAPDLVMEITSTHTSSRDYVRKLALYERHGVREYWIVDPLNRIVLVFRLSKSRKYGKPDTYGQGDSVKVGLFPDLAVPLPEVFTDL